MLTGDQLFAARTQAGMTQQELADAVGATQRSVGNWERAERVPKGAEQKVRTALAAYLNEGASQGAGLSEVSDALLLAEIARRFDRGREDVGPDVRAASTRRAGESPAEDDGEGAEILGLPSTRPVPKAARRGRKQRTDEPGDGA